MTECKESVRERKLPSRIFLEELSSIKFEETDMKTFLNRPHVFFVILLLCCWGCGDTPTSVMELVLPDSNDTAEPPGENAIPATEAVAEEMPPSVNTMGLSEMEAILASEGEVHSPIPDDVYEQLWGEWTKVGLTTPRGYYTKYIDAGGIAIVGSDNVEDRWFQKARHVVLVMTSKLPGLREALSADQVGGVTGDESPFRLVLTHRPSQDFVNMPEHLNANLGNTIYWYGSFHGYYARVDVKDTVVSSVLIHEMAHAIEHAIRARNLLQNFGERLDTAFDREMEKVQRRWEVDGNPYLPFIAADGTIVRHEDLPEWNRPLYCMANSNSHDDAGEFWAWFVEFTWFGSAFDPFLRSLEPNYEPIRDTWCPECPNLVGVTEEVFPAFPLHWAIHAKDY